MARLESFTDEDLLDRINDSMLALEERARAQINLELRFVSCDHRMDIDQLRLDLRRTIRKTAALYEPGRSQNGWSGVMKQAVKNRITDAIRTRPKAARNCPEEYAVALGLDSAHEQAGQDEFAAVDERIDREREHPNLRARLQRCRSGLEIAIGRIDAIEEDLTKSWLQGVLF